MIGRVHMCHEVIDGHRLISGGSAFRARVIGALDRHPRPTLGRYGTRIEATPLVFRPSWGLPPLQWRSPAHASPANASRSNLPPMRGQCPSSALLQPVPRSNEPSPGPCSTPILRDGLIVDILAESMAARMSRPPRIHDTTVAADRSALGARLSRPYSSIDLPSRSP